MPREVPGHGALPLMPYLFDTHFTRSELCCSHCGELAYFQERDVVEGVEELREACGFPLRITSGFRCPEHPAEQAKPAPGSHFRHQALDVALYGYSVVELVSAALPLGYKGFGFSQRDANYVRRFVHIDRGAPRVWSY